MEKLRSVCGTKMLIPKLFRSKLKDSCKTQANFLFYSSTGTALLSTFSVRSSIVNLSIESELLEEPQINLSSKIEFSGQTAICMQLSQPNTLFQQTITKSIHVQKQKINEFKQQTKLRYHLPGYTHVLNRKNTEMCNKILK